MKLTYWQEFHSTFSTLFSYTENYSIIQSSLLYTNSLINTFTGISDVKENCAVIIIPLYKDNSSLNNSTAVCYWTHVFGGCFMSKDTHLLKQTCLGILSTNICKPRSIFCCWKPFLSWTMCKTQSHLSICWEIKCMK